VPPREPKPADGYRLVERAPHGASVWDVVANPEPAFVTLAGFAAPQRTPHGFIGYTFAATSGAGAIQFAARSAATVRLFFTAVPPAGKTSVVRFDASNQEQTVTLNGQTAVSILVAVPRGQSQLFVKTSDPIVISTPRTETSSAQPALQAELVSSSPGI
jgi:hypothetical protein